MASYLFATAVLGSHLAKASLASYIRDKEPNPREKSNYRQNHTIGFHRLWKQCTFLCLLWIEKHMLNIAKQ